MKDNQKINIVAKYIGVDNFKGANMEVISNPADVNFGMIIDKDYNDVIDFSEVEKEGYDKVEIKSGSPINRKSIIGFCKMM